MNKRIEITVAPDGSITAEGSAGPGEACLRELDTVRALLPWATVTGSRLTPAYFGVVHESDHEASTWTHEENR